MSSLSKESLSSMLHLPILDFQSSPACDEGDNVAGSVQTLTVTTPGPTPTSTQTLHLIFKEIPQNPPDWIIEYKIFRVERAVYTSLGPRLSAFAASRGSSYLPPFPKYYAGHNNDRTDYLLLQDLRPFGYTMRDKRKSLSYLEMKLALEQLAAFHGTAYAFLRHEGSRIFEEDEDFALFAQPKSKDMDMFDGEIQRYFAVGAKRVVQKFPQIAGQIEKIAPSAWRIRKEAVGAGAAGNNPKLFTTLLHSDLWTNNILFKYDGNGNIPQDVKFIDFQLVSKGVVFNDLQYFIFTSTSPELRRECLGRLLDNYYDAFTKTLEGLGTPCPVGFTRGFFLDEFRRWYIPALIHMMFAIPLQLGDFHGVLKDYGERLEKNMDEAIGEMWERSGVAKDRLEEIVQEFIEIGIF